jgi:hypothetical protein
MNQHALKASIGLLTCAALTTGCSTFGVQREEITPQRPTISQDTRTTAYGTFEEELGILADPGDEYALQTRTSVGLSEKSELFLLWDVFRQVDNSQVLADLDGNGKDESGFGDAIIGFKQRLIDETDNLPATAIQIGTSIPIGSDDGELNRGRIDWFGALIADRTFGRLAMTGFYQLGILGTATPGDIDTEHTFALDGRWAFDDRINIGAEVATQVQGEIDFEPVYLTTYGQYKVSKSMNFDAGLRVGLSEDSDDVVFLIGLTTNLGRFF